MNNIPIILRLTLLVASVFLSACSPEPTDSVSPEPVSINSLATGTSNEVSSQPNILLIIGDDMGFSDVGAFGSEVATPNIDALAFEGLSFTNFHVGATCSPTRSLLLTGVDNHRSGLGAAGPPRSEEPLWDAGAEQWKILRLRLSEPIEATGVGRLSAKPV